MVETTYSQDFPVEVHYYNCQNAIYHRHSDLELFFVLSGEMEMFVNNSSFSIHSEDVFLVNPNEFHLIGKGNCELFSIQFHPDKLIYAPNAGRPYFDLNSSGHTNIPKYDYIRYLIAQFVKINSCGEHVYKTISMIYAIYSHLTENFSISALQPPLLSQLKQERITSIMTYIEEHYKECLTLADVAASQNLSASYLASFFEKHTGKTFLTYYNEIRLLHAINDMLATDESLENIALENGFHDVRSFTSLFKRKYHQLPSVYRKKYFSTHSSYIDEEARREKNSRESIEKVSSYPSLIKYQTYYCQDATPASLLEEPSKTIDAGEINFFSDAIPLTHTYRKVMCIGSAKQFLYQEIQEMIRVVQKEIHYSYVKFHGLLSDDMMVYTEKPDGTPVYTFTLLDKAFDFMLSVGLRPLCQLAFMPMALASDPSKMVDLWHYNTSPPKDMKKWHDLINALIHHFITRYGINEVRHWLFSVWNEPDGTITEFSWPDQMQFFYFYQISWNAVKNIDSSLAFGTPSLLLSLVASNGWADAFFSYCKENNCMPDFINIHYYDNTLFSSDHMRRISNQASSHFPLTEDSYSFMTFINNIKYFFKCHGLTSLPVYLTEWNLTISHRDLINDTCFKSCYLIKNLLENYDRLNSFGYWCLTDFIEELPIPNELYHGGLGMFTHNGIPKSHFNAFRFLTHLDNDLIGKGNGYFITRSAEHISILVYNYEHYSKIFASEGFSHAYNENRYNPFSDMNTAQFSIKFNTLPYKKCLIKEMFVNQSFGSSYDAWVRMGAQHLTKRNEFELLRQQSHPGMLLHQEPIKDGILAFHTHLAPLEVRLIEIEFWK